MPPRMAKTVSKIFSKPQSPVDIAFGNRSERRSQRRKRQTTARQQRRVIKVFRREWNRQERERRAAQANG